MSRLARQMGQKVTTGAPLALSSVTRRSRISRFRAGDTDSAGPPQQEVNSPQFLHFRIRQAHAGEQTPGPLRDFQVPAVKTGVVDGHRRPAVAAADLAGPEEGEIRLHFEAHPDIFRIKLFQGIGGVRIDRDDFLNAMELQGPGHEPGVLHKALLIPQIVEQDTAVEVHFRVIEEVRPGFRQQPAYGLEDAVKLLFFRG